MLVWWKRRTLRGQLASVDAALAQIDYEIDVGQAEQFRARLAYLKTPTLDVRVRAAQIDRRRLAQRREGLQQQLEALP